MNKDYRIIETANNEFKIQKRLFGLFWLDTCYSFPYTGKIVIYFPLHPFRGEPEIFDSFKEATLAYDKHMQIINKKAKDKIITNIWKQQ